MLIEIWPFVPKSKGSPAMGFASPFVNFMWVCWGEEKRLMSPDLHPRGTQRLP